MEVFVVWLFFAVLVGWLASSRGRSGFGFFLLSALLSPLIGLIVVLVTKNLVAEQTMERERAAEQARQETARKEEHERQLAAINALAGARHEAPPAGKLVADELEKLVSLRDRGALTQAEFEAQKARVLGGSA